MATGISAWEILNGSLKTLDTTLMSEGRTEAYDLEEWIASDPTIIGYGLKVIGRQVITRSGPLDLLAIDQAGNLVVIELKRDRLPREVIAQALDYASDVATWGVDKVREICAKYTGDSLEDVLSEAFPDVDLENLAINESQRVVLVGFSIESSLERMIEWLSEQYGVGVNAVILKYLKTSAGNEILTRTTIISEQAEVERIKTRKFTIPMSDEPGNYEAGQLRELLSNYLSQDLVTAQRIRNVLLPVCLEREGITREQLKQEFFRRGAANDISKIGLFLTVISGQLGMQKNDFLRQVIAYEYPNNAWEKDNFSIRLEYRGLVKELLETLGEKAKT